MVNKCSTLVLVAATSLLAGCDKPEWYYDQTARQEIFMKCLEKAPAGPVSTKYNDWSEVVTECDSAAYRQSYVSETHRRAPGGVEK